MMLGRTISSLFPTGMPLPVLRGPARGRLWLVGAAPGPSKGLSVLWNRSEAPQLEAARRLARNARYCFDIGAHAGLYSLVFASAAERVFAFEPLPRNIAWLERTLAWNRIPNVSILPWAVSEATGPQSFQPHAHNSMGRLAPDGSLPVFAIALDDFLARHPFFPEVMKIDVEGAETSVLRGGLEFIRSRKPALLLSVHGPERRRECLELLRDAGYSRIHPLDAGNPDQANEYCVEA
jgi:FkbM family methyltransferase